jgi:hypothetical protein
VSNRKKRSDHRFLQGADGALDTATILSIGGGDCRGFNHLLREMPAGSVWCFW